MDAVLKHGVILVVTVTGWGVVPRHITTVTNHLASGGPILQVVDMSSSKPCMTSSMPPSIAQNNEASKGSLVASAFLGEKPSEVATLLKIGDKLIPPEK